MKIRHLKRWAIIAFIGVGLLSASTAIASDRDLEKKSVAAVGSSCSMPEGWSQVAVRRPRYIIFGEDHGTKEAPAFVGNVACALAAKGERILVAVEHQATNDAAFQAAWLLPHAQFEAALRAAGWEGREDGVASEAMLRLLVRLHSLKAEGKSIGIVAFNGDRDDVQRGRFKSLPGQGGHEAAQAENIRDAAGADKYDHVLVLTGNLHARKQEVEREKSTFKPMAMMLAPADQIVSLNMESAKGSAWNCILKPGHEPQPGKPILADAVDCGIHSYDTKTDLHRSPFISLTPVEGINSDGAYDGIVWLGTTNGSKPAAPKK